jgi:hypothetical protein
MFRSIVAKKNRKDALGFPGSGLTDAEKGGIYRTRFMVQVCSRNHVIITKV